MKYLFCIYGGSGSTYLANQLRRQGITCHVRPDTFFVPQIVEGRGNHKKGVSSQIQLVKNYIERPELSAAEELSKRSGYPVDINAPIAGQIIKYIKWAQGTPDHTAMFNYLGVGRFFSQFQIQDIIIVLRHPLHNFVSVYGHQHPEKVRDMGGIDTEESVRFFADIWNAMAIEVMESQNPVVRYEYAQADFKQIPEVPPKMKGLFDSWDSSKRNHGELSEENEQLLYTLVKREYHKIYGDWEI